MNMFKKNGGFTLVELIVVIAILAILAGIAIPAYSGYIQKANDTACYTELSAIQTAAQAACALEGTSVTGISIATAAGTGVAAGDVTITPAVADDDIADNFAELYTTTGADLIALLEKHDDYTAGTAVTWSVDNGWSLLAE